MTAAVIGVGSVGSRHVSNLLELGCSEVLLLRRADIGNPWGLREITSLDELLEVSPDLTIVCTPSARHIQVLPSLIEHDLNVLCEKPMISDESQLALLSDALRNYSGVGRVCFNLRFHPCVMWCRSRLPSIGFIHYGSFSVGQFLPDWRPGQDHLESYSAKREEGGGVILDLIHEIDLSIHLLGEPDRRHPVSIVSRSGSVTVDSEDQADILFTCSGAHVHVHMDYLRRGIHRTFRLDGSEGSLHVDLVTDSAYQTDSRGDIIERFSVPGFDRNDMFISAIKEYLELVRQNGRVEKTLPTFESCRPALHVALTAKASIGHGT